MHATNTKSELRLSVYLSNSVRQYHNAFSENYVFLFDRVFCMCWKSQHKQNPWISISCIVHMHVNVKIVSNGKYLGDRMWESTIWKRKKSLTLFCVFCRFDRYHRRTHSVIDTKSDQMRIRDKWSLDARLSCIMNYFISITDLLIMFICIIILFDNFHSFFFFPEVSIDAKGGGSVNFRNFRKI